MRSHSSKRKEHKINTVVNSAARKPLSVCLSLLVRAFRLYDFAEFFASQTLLIEKHKS